MTAARRRWSFGLRTMLVVVGVLCVVLCWISGQWQVVRARKALIADLEVRPGLQVFNAENELVRFFKADEYYRQLSPGKTFSIPWHRRFLGDEPFLLLYVPAHRKSEAESLFPEACVETSAR